MTTLTMFFLRVQRNNTTVKATVLDSIIDINFFKVMRWSEQQKVLQVIEES